MSFQLPSLHLSKHLSLSPQLPPSPLKSFKSFEEKLQQIPTGHWGSVVGTRTVNQALARAVVGVPGLVGGTRTLWVELAPWGPWLCGQSQEKRGPGKPGSSLSSSP